MADKTVTKTELVASIASATGLSQSAVSGILDSLFSTVSDAIASGSRVSIPGWIAFEQVATSARTGRNPQTGEEIKIPAGKRVKVTVGGRLRQAVPVGATSSRKRSAKSAAPAIPTSSREQIDNYSAPRIREVDTVRLPAAVLKESANEWHDRELKMVRAIAQEQWVGRALESWFIGRNSFLGGARPIDVVRTGGVAQVLTALEAESSGAFA